MTGHYGDVRSSATAAGWYGATATDPRFASELIICNVRFERMNSFLQIMEIMSYLENQHFSFSSHWKRLDDENHNEWYGGI